MGTRHTIRIIDKEGKEKLRQYGQWDGYPSGQGVDILRFLDNNIYALEYGLDDLKEMREKDWKEVEKCDDHTWKFRYPALSRDIGSRILYLIAARLVDRVYFVDLEEAKTWCEGFYEINFKDRIFKTTYNGKETEYFLDALPSVEEYKKQNKD